MPAVFDTDGETDGRRGARFAHCFAAVSGGADEPPLYRSRGWASDFCGAVERTIAGGHNRSGRYRRSGKNGTFGRGDWVLVEQRGKAVPQGQALGARREVCFCGSASASLCRGKSPIGSDATAL